MSAVRYLNPAVETQVLADRINARLGAAVEAIVAVGIELIAAKGGLPHGEFGRSDRLRQGAAARREKADDLERDAQQLRGGDGARQAAALMTRMQTLASMSYNQLYRIGQLDPTAPELPQRPAR